MYQDKSFLAIIPARSGSKRLPDKNIKNLCGHPLIAWSIKAGLGSKYIDRVVVSTDSQEYADIAKSYGAEAPFLRPKELSLDTSTTFDSIKHTIDFYQNELNQIFNYIVLLQPTSPLRSSEMIDSMCEWIIENNYHMSISVSECDHPPCWSNTLPQDNNMRDFLTKDVVGKRSQDLPMYYRINGVLYIAKTESLLQYNGFLSPETYAYIIDKHFAIDIDTQIDFDYAEFLKTKCKKGHDDEIFKNYFT